LLWVAAAILAGCAPTRDGAQFTSVLQTVGPPKPGLARIVVLRPRGFGGLFDSGWSVTLDRQPIAELKTGTFIYIDAPAGRHEMGANMAFPGQTRYEFATSAGRTYFFTAVVSQRARALQSAQAAGGLIAWGLATAITSDDKNPGPLDYVPVDEVVARQTITELRLANN
jgi:hypothetical protein